MTLALCPASRTQESPVPSQHPRRRRSRLRGRSQGRPAPVGSGSGASWQRQAGVQRRAEPGLPSGPSQCRAHQPRLPCSLPSRGPKLLPHGTCSGGGARTFPAPQGGRRKREEAGIGSWSATQGYGVGPQGAPAAGGPPATPVSGAEPCSTAPSSSSGEAALGLGPLAWEPGGPCGGRALRRGLGRAGPAGQASMRCPCGVSVPWIWGFSRDRGVPPSCPGGRHPCVPASPCLSRRPQARTDSARTRGPADTGPGPAGA